ASQELVRITSASVTFPKFNVVGSIDEIPASGNNPAIPGLVVRQNGFSVGQAQLRCGGASPTLQTTNNQPFISLGGVLEMDDLRIGVTNFSVTFGTNVSFTGTIFVASAGARFLPGKPVSATISDRNTADDKNPNGTPNDEAIRLELSFKPDGTVDAFKFKVDTIVINISSYVEVSAR